MLCVFHTISAGVRLLSFGLNAASAEGFFSCTPAVFSRVNAPRLTQPLGTICFLASEVKVRGRVRGGASVFFTFMNLMNTLLFKTYSAGASLKIETFHRITLGLQSMISSLRGYVTQQDNDLQHTSKSSKGWKRTRFVFWKVQVRVTVWP